MAGRFTKAKLASAPGGTTNIESHWASHTAHNGNWDVTDQALDTLNSQISSISSALSSAIAELNALKNRVTALEDGSVLPQPSARVMVANLADTAKNQTIPATGTTKTFRMAFVLHSDCTDLEFVWDNNKLNADGTNSGLVDIAGIAVSMKPENGALSAVNFGTDREVSLAIGEKKSSVIAGNFPKGRYILNVRLRGASAGGGWPGSLLVGPGWNGLGAFEGDALDNDNASFNVGTYQFTPAAILGTTNNKVVSVHAFGNSIFGGLEDGDGAADTNSNRGFMSKGMSAAGIPTVRTATVGIELETVIGTNGRAHYDRAVSMNNADIFVFELTTNDFYNKGNSLTLSAVQGRWNNLFDWAVSKGKAGKVIVVTPPALTSNSNAIKDGFTVMNQMYSWLLSKPHAAIGGIWDYRKFTTILETGLWKDITDTADGIHPSKSGTEKMVVWSTARGNALKAGILDESQSGGGTVTEPQGFNPSTVTNKVTLSGTNNRVMTMTGEGAGLGGFAKITVKAGERKVFAVRFQNIGEDAYVGMTKVGASMGHFADGFDSPALIVAGYRGQAFVNQTRDMLFQGINLDLTNAVYAVDRTTSGTLKFWFYGNQYGWNMSQRGDSPHSGGNPALGTGGMEVAFSDADEAAIMVGNGYVTAGNSSIATLNESHGDFSDLLPTLPSGFSDLATGTSSGGGKSNASDTSGGVAYQTPTGAGDGTDGAYTFGETAIADPVASRGRLRVAATPLSAGSGNTLTFWSHDYFSTQGVNCNLIEDVNRERFTFVKGFLKHLRPALIRVAMTSDDANIANMYKQLCDEVGCKMVFQGMSFNDYASYGTIAQKAAACVSRVKLMGGSQYIAWLEGMNEVDLNLWRFGAANNAAAISMMVDMHTQCYNALKADAATSGIFIAAPSCTNTNGTVSANVNTAIQGMSSKYDAGNARWYSGKWEPNMPLSGVDGNGYGTIEKEISNARATAGGKTPVVITECGYHNGILVTLGHLPVREDTASLYMPDIFTRPYSQGARVVTNYQITDFITQDGRTQTDKSIDQENFGYLRYGAKGVKPAGITMARFNAKLRDDTAPPTMVAIPAHTVTGVNNPVKYNFQKSNGQYIISIKDGRRAVDVDTEKWSNGTQVSPFNPNALLIYPETTGNIKFDSKDWSKVECYNVHLDTTTELTKKSDGSYDFPVSQKTSLLIFTP